MNQFSTLFVVVLWFLQTESVVTLLADPDLAQPVPLGYCNSGPPQDVEVRKKNAQLAAAIARAAQYLAQQHVKTPPADLVSVALASQQPPSGYQTVAEDFLTYGFAKIPCYKPQRNSAKAVDEADLYRINGEVMELKQGKMTVQKIVSSEAVDQILEQFSGSSRQLPTLSQLGYVPAKCYQVKQM